MTSAEEQMMRQIVDAIPPGSKLFGNRIALRDQFAAIALQALITEPVPAGCSGVVHTIARKAYPDAVERAQVPCEALFAEASYAIADAMLEARAKVRT
jgi:hypothetical protein